MSNTSGYALSTSWNYSNHKDAKGIVDEIRSIGFDSIELNFALTQTQVNDFIALKNSGYIDIVSAHNFCPLPDGVEQKDASPEYYSLSSLDDDERRLAIKFTKKSMDFAKRAGAGALILHLGWVQIKDRTNRLFIITDEARRKKEKIEFLLERETKVKPFLQRSMDSLKELLRYTETIDLNIAIENRYYIKEIPSLEELKTIFKTFNNKYLSYWHDIGHAQVYENLSILRHEEYLDALSNYLIGVHLHDIIVFDDHRAPGRGEFNFKRLRPYIKKDTIKVIEVHRRTTKEEVKDSLKFLKGVLGECSENR